MTFRLASNETALGERPAHWRLICPRHSRRDLGRAPASIDAAAIRRAAAAYAEPASTFGLELKLAYAMEACGLGGDEETRRRRPFFRLAQEPIIWSWWDALQRVPLDRAEMLACASMLNGQPVAYREREMFAHGGGVEPPLYYETPDAARSWIGDIAAVDGAEGDPVKKALYRFVRTVIAHPFTDANGRFARAALQAGLARAGVIASPCLALAPLFYLRAVDVRAALRDLSRSGCWRDAFDRLGAVLAKAPRWLAAPQ